MLDRIFLLSHMRANTSLIGHILGSHPEISGYYEMHLGYESSADLENQEKIYTEKETVKENSRFLFDKLLHNQYGLDLEKIQQIVPVQILVSFRKPEQSIKSILHLFSKKPGNPSYANPKKATQYYIERLSWIDQFCRENPECHFYYDADLIRTDAENTLSKMTQWLSLNSPLDSNYQIFSNTGKARTGDSSDNIKSGKIITSENHYTEIQLDPDLLAEAEHHFHQHRKNVIDLAKESAIFSN